MRLFVVALVLCTAALAAGCARPDASLLALNPVRPAAESPLAAAGFRLPAPRPARPSPPGLADMAKTAFWAAFTAGAYDALPNATLLLTAAYLQNPQDAEVTLLLAHAHLWKVSERRRSTQRDPTITDHLVLAETYFEEAYRLAPADHRIVGWLGSARAPLGVLRGDSLLAAEGYALLEEAAARYPQFNHFTAGFSLSALPASDPRFAVGLEHLWQNMESCVGARREAGPDVYALAGQTDTSCANAEKAPHNYEGFMLTLGDMLVKSGQPAEARTAYGRARFAPTYETWPYREMLEQRLLTADESAALFARATPDEAPETVFGSAYSCVVCHQR